MVKKIPKEEINMINTSLTKRLGLVFVVVIAIFLLKAESVYAQLNNQIPMLGRTIPKYVNPLPHFANNRVDGTKALTVKMKEFQQVVLPSTFINPVTGQPYKTTVWGYEIADGTNTYGPLYPAFTIEAQRNIPTIVTYINDLGNQTLYTPQSSTIPGILPVDQTLHWADPFMQHPSQNTYTGPVPAVVHLHGGEVPSIYDGHPEAWFTPNSSGAPVYTGPAWNTTNPFTNVYTYPNTQESANIWFHDHALGVTRLNVYAGLAGFYLIRDQNTLDTGIPAAGGLPAGNYEIEIAIQDRMFDTDGQLYFPNLGINIEHPFWIPEFVGDVIVVNGKTWPFLNVEPRRYRFRFLDGSNARFYDMFIENKITATPGPVFWQIGTDGAMLDNPVKLDPNDPITPRRLLVGPGERADIIIDFSGFAGQTLTLRNIARAPFPRGATPDPQTTGQIMQFRVILPLSSTDNTLNPATGASLRTPLVKLVNFTNGTVAPGVTIDKTRQLTLNEVMGAGGPLEILVNNTKWDGMMSPNAGGITELPTEGKTEVWKIINLTADAHPIHLHLVQFQLVSRQNFNISKYFKVYNGAFKGGISPIDGMQYPNGVYIPGYGPPKPYNNTNPLGGNPNVALYLQGPARTAEPNEAGWKDTFIMYPREVTTIIVRWAPTSMPITTPPNQLLFNFDPSVGPGYVWHCHIIDHEDNEMMRPYQVLPNTS